MVVLDCRVYWYDVLVPTYNDWDYGANWLNSEECFCIFALYV